MFEHGERDNIDDGLKQLDSDGGRPFWKDFSCQNSASPGYLDGRLTNQVWREQAPSLVRLLFRFMPVGRACFTLDGMV